MLAGPDGRPNPTTLSVFARDVAEPVDLVTGPGGDLYYPSISTGPVRRIRHFAANVPPVASFTVTPPGGPVPLQVTFDAAGSRDPDGDALEHRWDLDGEGYRVAAGQLTVAPGRRRAEVRIRVRGDRWPERDETLRVALTAVAGARRAPAAKATLTIRNDDGPVYGVARR